MNTAHLFFAGTNPTHQVQLRVYFVATRLIVDAALKIAYFLYYFSFEASIYSSLCIFIMNLLILKIGDLKSQIKPGSTNEVRHNYVQG
jgi:hypothetical protein